MYLQEPLFLEHEDPPRIHYPCYWPNYIIYSSTYGPQLALHQIPHKYHIISRYLFN